MFAELRKCNDIFFFPCNVCAQHVKRVKTNSPEEARVRSTRAEKSQTGPAVRRIPLPFTQRAFLSLSALVLISPSDDWCLAPLALRRLVRRRRHPTPAAEAFVCLIAGDEHPPGIPMLFSSLPAVRSRALNPNLKLFGNGSEWFCLHVFFGRLVPNVWSFGCWRCLEHGRGGASKPRFHFAPWRCQVLVAMSPFLVWLGFL
jgi:hypothetical protein